MLEHLSVARQQFLVGEGVEEKGGDDHKVGVAESADFVFETVEVDAGLPADRCVDGAQKSCGDVDETDAAFVACSRKGAHVGDHASAEVYQQRTAVGVLLLELFPYRLQRVDILVHLAGLDADDAGIGHCGRHPGDYGEHKGLGIDIHQNVD